MKGVVLSGGNGTRLRPITYSMAKQLVPVANKPVVFYGLEQLGDAGIKDVGIVVSPETGGEIRAAVGDGSSFGLSATYIVQPKPQGLAHALKTALDFVDGDDCLMYLGDNLLRTGVTGIVDDFERERPNCRILVSPVEDPRAFGVAELAPDGSVRRLVEKPREPASDLALVGVYLFDHTVAEAVDSITPSARGELEITDAIQYLVDHGRDVRASLVDGWWKDTGKKVDLLNANELILAELEDDIRGRVIRSTIRGRLSLGPGSVVLDSEIEGPVSIGPRTRVVRSTIATSTSIGAECLVQDASIRSSIVLDKVEIVGWTLRDSLIGARTRVRGPIGCGPTELTLGERSELVGAEPPMARARD